MKVKLLNTVKNIVANREIATKFSKVVCCRGPRKHLYARLLQRSQKASVCSSAAEVSESICMLVCCGCVKLFLWESDKAKIFDKYNNKVLNILEISF